MSRRRRLDRLALRVLALAAFVAGGVLRAAPSPEVVLHLKSGDRVSGAMLSETLGQVVLSNRWSADLVVPLNEIAWRETIVVGTNGLPAPSGLVQTVLVKPPARPGAKSRVLQRLSGDAQVGLDLLYGAPDRQVYNGAFKLVYERPYKRNPHKVFKNSLDYSVEYGRTDGVKSSDRMAANDKADFDTGRNWYVYNLAGVGYDHILKINLQYEVGPGVGYHLFTRPEFLMNAEAGVSYDSQSRSDGPSVRDFFYRLAEDFTWKAGKRTTVTETFEFLPRRTFDEYRFHYQSTLSYELWWNLAWNLSVSDLYDSRPAPGVESSEFEVRSGLGVKF